MKNLTTLRTAMIGLAIASPIAAQEKAAPISEAELLRRLSATFDSAAKRGDFSGAILVARHGTPVFEKAYGYADRESGRKNAIETAFNLGSINKLFTAIALRQLAAEGKVNLDSTLAKAWPDYPNRQVASRVTIRQILQHRSGIGGNIFAAPPGGKRHDIKHNNAYLQLFVAESLRFEPGTRQQYSNAGYIVLGALVERLAGMDYYRYVHERIFAPAGMKHTASYRVDSLPAFVAVGYTREATDGTSGDALRRNTDMLPGRGSAAGGGYSTAHDLMRFFQALREGKIAGGPPPGAVGAAGGAPGINAVIDGDLPGGYDVIVLTNLDPPAAEKAARTIRGWLGAEN